MRKSSFVLMVLALSGAVVEGRAEAQVAAPASAAVMQPPAGTGTYADLLTLHEELRAYMVPAFTSSVVLDSGARVGQEYADGLMATKLEGLAAFESRLANMNVAAWPRAQQVEFLAVKSLLNGYRFNLEVLRPWKRDPGFYLDPLMRVAFTSLPVEGAELERLRQQLRAVSPMLQGAQANLTEGAADFADLALFNLDNSDGVNHYHPYRSTPPAGIVGWYDDLLGRARTAQPDLVKDVEEARRALTGFRAWLKRERPRMTASAGVGEKRFEWFITHVRMIPYSPSDMGVLARREHQRLTGALALLRNRNRNLPDLALSATAAEQDQKVAETDRIVREFLVREQIITIPDYVGNLGSNTPWIERPGGPNFWEKIQFRDPIPDHLHAVIPGHRFDAVVSERDNRPIRGRYSEGARVEGWGTYLEESMQIAGATRHSPRADEFITLFGIFRATRVTADVQMQRNSWNAAEAVKFMRANTPWLDEDVARVDAEIYLRRPPGYGLAYTIGKLQMDALLAQQSQKLGDDFSLKAFHDSFLAAGRLPIALIGYEMGGDPADIAAFWQTPPLPN